MKVAVCLKGQPRNYQVGFDSIHKEFISKYDADVFAHAWWDPKEVGQYYRAAPWATSYPSTVQSNLDMILPLIYDFKKFIIEPLKDFKINRQYLVSPVDEPFYENIIQILLSSYYSLKLVLELMEEYEKENNIDYDWVFLTRYDVKIFKFISDLSLLDRDYIYTSPMHRGRTYIFNDCGYLLGKHKYVFKTMFDNFDYDYDLKMDIENTPFIKQILNTELVKNKYMSGEVNIALHLLFNNLLDNVIKHPELEYNLIREGQDPNINTYIF